MKAKTGVNSGQGIMNTPTSKFVCFLYHVAIWWHGGRANSLENLSEDYRHESFDARTTPQERAYFERREIEAKQKAMYHSRMAREYEEMLRK